MWQTRTRIILFKKKYEKKAYGLYHVSKLVLVLFIYLFY